MPIFSIDADHLATYCPACLDGVMLIRFLSHPEPGMAISDGWGGPPGCSRGCTEELINEVLFG